MEDRRTLTREDLTPAQLATLDHVVQGVLRKNDLGQPGRTEVKRLEISEAWGGSAFVVLEVGMVSDEGTMASVFCRDYRHLWIGKRGGIELLNPRGVKKRNIRRLSGRWNAVYALSS